MKNKKIIDKIDDLESKIDDILHPENKIHNGIENILKYMLNEMEEIKDELKK